MPETWDWGADMKKPATFLSSAALTIFIIGGIIVFHELSDQFKQLLIDMIGHHWVSESIIAIVVFLLASIFLLRSEKSAAVLKTDDLRMWSRVLVAATLLAIIGTLSVYLYHMMA